jgi:hypothetical protein
MQIRDVEMADRNATVIRSRGSQFFGSPGLSRRRPSGMPADYLTRLDVIVLEDRAICPSRRPGGQLLFHLIS